MSFDNTFTKENLNSYLKELAKEFRKLNGVSVPAEIILIGGASILANYGFREMTYDMDAIISASSAMKEAINKVGDKFNLPNGWLNSDFVRTKSYTPKLIEVSVYYKTYSNILTVRSVAAEYLIAMKLMSGRKYKNDLSDIIGILSEHQRNGNPITYEVVKKAVFILYDDWSAIPADSKDFIDSVFSVSDYEALYQQIRENELQSKDILIEFQKENSNVTNEESINDILEKAKLKKL